MNWQKQCGRLKQLTVMCVNNLKELCSVVVFFLMQFDNTVTVLEKFLLEEPFHVFTVKLHSLIITEL